MPVTINGTSGVVSPDGSAGTPAYQGSDANTGMFFPAADTIAFAEGGVEVARFNSSGNFGLGITPSAWGAYTVLQNKNFSLGGFDYGQGILTLNGYYDGSTWRAIDTGAATQYKHFVGQHQWFTAPSASAGGALTWTQAMTLTSGGTLLVGDTATSSYFDGKVSAFGSALPGVSAKTSGGATMPAITAWNTATSGDNRFVEFATEASPTARGTITYNRAGGLVAYNTTSDYRAKDIAGPVANALATVGQFKPYMGTMKGATVERPMFVAHEIQEVAPYAVVGGKDAIDEEGAPIYQQMDHSTLVPLLTAAIQEQQSLITSLTARIAALEGAAQ